MPAHRMLCQQRVNCSGKANVRDLSAGPQIAGARVHRHSRVGPDSVASRDWRCAWTSGADAKGCSEHRARGPVKFANIPQDMAELGVRVKAHGSISV